MKVAVVGNGSIGQRHSRNLRALGCEVVTVDPNGSADHLDVSAIGPVDAAVIATPAAEQMQMMSKVMDLHLGALVEKPFGLIAPHYIFMPRWIQVGYNLRWDPSVIRFADRLRNGEAGRVLWARVEFGSHINRWRPGRDYRTTPAVDGILLEASHEIDLLLWLFGPIRRIVGAHLGRTLEVREDQCSAIFEMESGATVEFHLDMLRHGYRRRIEVIGDKDTLTWSPDWLINGGVNDDLLNRCYVEEVKAFLRCVETGEKPLVGVEEAIAVHRVIEQIRDKANEA